MTQFTFSHPLDWNNHYRLTFDYASKQHEISGQISGPPGSTGTVERHLATLIALNVAGRHCRLAVSKYRAPSFSMTLPKDRRGDFECILRLGGKHHDDGEIYGRHRIRNGQLDASEILQRLTVFETRMLGNERLYRWLPYPRQVLPPDMPRTDLHTHSSGQISAQGLIDVAIAHNIAYPTRLLDLLGIAYDKNNVGSARRFFFPPIDGGNPDAIPKTEAAISVNALPEAGRDKLKAALSIPPDRQMTFGDLEQTVYRYRYPIAKHPDAAYELWLKVGEEYARQGITYAEITSVSTSFLMPQHLRFLHDALPRIERVTGVSIRFLAGIPRNLPHGLIAREIEKLKLMGISPYIVGIDFMGFEDSKIIDLEPYIQSIAEWAHRHDPEFTLRIHAGENRKNLTNVKESLRLAEKYRMRVRIGHAAHGLDDDAIRIAETLAQDKLVMIEFNPDSNLALNNIDTAEELDMLRCLNKGIPFVVCSDGGGLYQTDARQLWTAASFAASFAGVAPDRVGYITQSENDHIKREEARFAAKKKHLPPDFLDQVAETCDALAKVPTTPEPALKNSTVVFEQHLRQQGIAFAPDAIAAATKGKVPLLILGATGERYWNMIAASHKRQVHTAIDMLVERLDPRKVYFLIGRPKDEGITALLSRAIQKYNAQPPLKQPFALISATVQADQTAHSFTPGLTHVLPLTGSLFTVPNQLVGYVAKHKGHILFIGGGTFVRDAILIARDSHGVQFGLMNGPEGASTDKAVMMDTDRQFVDAEGLIMHLLAAHPDWFHK